MCQKEDGSLELEQKEEEKNEGKENSDRQEYKIQIVQKEGAKYRAIKALDISFIKLATCGWGENH